MPTSDPRSPLKSARALPLHLSQALPQEARDAIDGPGAASRTHSGDEAHDRVQAMLAETVDTELWHAQRVLQSASTDAVNLSGCDALTRALDVAAGDAAALSGTEPLLIERIDSEYARYFTADRPPHRRMDARDQGAGGRQPGGRALCRGGRRGRRPGAAACRADRRAGRVDRAAAGRRERPDRRPSRGRRHRPARGAGAGSRLIAAAATATSTASTAGHAERIRLRTENDARTAASPR